MKANSQKQRCLALRYELICQIQSPFKRMAKIRNLCICAKQALPFVKQFDLAILLYVVLRSFALISFTTPTFRTQITRTRQAEFFLQ